MEIKQKKRNEIPNEYKWNLDVVCSTIEEWHNRVSAVQEAITGLPQYQGKLNNGKTLLEYLDKFHEVQD